MILMSNIEVQGWLFFEFWTLPIFLIKTIKWWSKLSVLCVRQYFDRFDEFFNVFLRFFYGDKWGGMLWPMMTTYAKTVPNVPIRPKMPKY